MQLPARIGKYELEEFLGGGMSHVYRARDTVIGRTVALKILTEQGCEDAEAKERFLAEARMAGNISHDNVLSIYDFGEDEQHHPFMVMEFLRGEDLRHAIKGNRTGGVREKLKIAVQIARALEYIHTQKIIHRDIKPENVNVSPAGVVKLMDFGIAKTQGLQMTQAGYVLGTPFYMAPEQVTGANVTEQVDVYAFGVLVFELMTGVKPIAGDTVERIFYSILNEPLNLEPMIQAGAPQSICDVVANCTKKSPAERPQGFGPVITELERILAELDAPTAMFKAPGEEAVIQEPSGPPKWLIPVVALVVVALAAGLYIAMKNKKAAEGTAKVDAPKPLPANITAKSGDMLLVEGGPFLFGPDRANQTIGAYYIDKTEVTNAAYKAFCDATQHALPKDFLTDKPNYPVVNVTIADARDFAKWAGERLPSAREWEKAARGPNGLEFPWGVGVDPSKVNLASAAAVPVTEFSVGVSPVGAFQMIGNVWELIEERTTPSDRAIREFRDMQPPPTLETAWYQARGGSYKTPLKQFVPELLTDSTPIPTGYSAPDIGFRCAKDAQ